MIISDQVEMDCPETRAQSHTVHRIDRRLSPPVSSPQHQPPFTWGVVGEEDPGVRGVLLVEAEVLRGVGRDGGHGGEGEHG